MLGAIVGRAIRATRRWRAGAEENRSETRLPNPFATSAYAVVALGCCGGGSVFDIRVR